MKFSKKWLQTIINPKIKLEKFSNILTMFGIQVEKTEKIIINFKNILIGKIINITKINNLKICKINIGYITYIKTYLKKIKSGIKIPCFLYKKKNNNYFNEKLYSKYKFSLKENYNKKIIKLSKNSIIGKKFFKKKISDVIFTLNIMPNRPDLLNILGLAKEIAILTNISIKKNKYKKNIINTNKKIGIKIFNNKLCNRFSGRVINNLNINISIPKWMKYRLKSNGQNQISTLIDIINYVAIETGYYFNIIDLDKISGNLNIRYGRNNEKITLLNKNILKINKKTAVISDKKKVISLMGLINNKHVLISSKTKNIYIKIIHWKKKITRIFLKKYNILTNLSTIFEKSIDNSNVIFALERITELLIKICGTSLTKIGPIYDNIINIIKRNIIFIKIKNIYKIIGINIHYKKIEKIFKRLNIKFIKIYYLYKTIPPNYRHDLKIEEDLIEEIARMYGYKNIPLIPPKSINYIKPHLNKRSLLEIRNLITNLDYQEVINYSFTNNKLEIDFMKNKKQINIINPISNKMNVMRSSLIPNLIKNIQYNINHKINKIRLFEIGTIFHINENVKNSQFEISGYKQEKYITCISYKKILEKQLGIINKNIDFFNIKLDLENLFIKQKLYFIKSDHPALHPKYSAKIFLKNKNIGNIGKLHPILQRKYNLPFSPVLFEIKAKSLQNKIKIKYKKILKYPEIIRDISLIVRKYITIQLLLNLFIKIKKFNKKCKFIKKIFFFDQFNDLSINNNFKSLSFRIIIQGKKNNLNDKIINLIIKTLILEIIYSYKLKLRF